MKFWSIATTLCVAAASAEEASPDSPPPPSCAPCDSAEWKSKAQEIDQLRQTCANELGSATGKVTACHDSLAAEQSKLSAHIAEIQKLTSALKEKDAQLTSAQTTEQTLAAVRAQLASAEQDKTAAAASLDTLAKTLQEKATALQAANEAKAQAQASVKAASEAAEKLKEALTQSQRNLADTKSTLKQLKSEFDMKNNAIMDKEKFRILLVNLWTFAKAGGKNAYDRLNAIVGKDKVESAINMANIYYRKTSVHTHEYVVDPTVKYYKTYAAATMAPILSKGRELAAEGMVKAEVHLEKAKKMIEVRVSRQVDKLIEQEPALGAVIPKKFEDRLYALGYAFGASYVVCLVIGMFGNFVLATISLVCCCRRRQKTKEKKKSHKTKTSSSSDSKKEKERKGSVSGPSKPNGDMPNSHKPTSSTNGNKKK